MDPRCAERGDGVTERRDARNGEGERPEGVGAALAMAEIPPSKLGPARRARLMDSERELYFWILRHFRTAGRPSSKEVREAAMRLGIDAEQGLATLAREDLVHRGSDAEITVAYPFSGQPTAHRVRFAGEQEVDAMCAIDALGIAPLFGEPIKVASRDPLSGDAIQTRIAPGGAVEWSPLSAVVVAGALYRQSEACCGSCPVLNFFASPVNAERWLAEHQEVRGDVISMPEAALAGRAVFGEVLTES
jgi:Alkylmercury lyase